MWLGPPYINRKMTLLAVAGIRGAFGASGFGNCVAARAAPVKKPSAESKDVSAAAPKPHPVSQRNSRRVRPQKLFRPLFGIPVPLVQIHELVAVQYGEAPVF